MSEIVQTKADVMRVLREARQQRGLSQQKVSEAAGYSRTWLVNIESGRFDVPLSSVLWLADHLGVTVSLQVREGGQR